MKVLKYTFFAGVALCCGGVNAANETNNSTGSMIGQTNDARVYWTLVCGSCPKMSPFVTVRLSSVTSVSKQRYLLNDSMNVWELVIDTEGNNTIRIYCIDSREKAKSITGSSLERNISAAVSRNRNTGSLNGSECVTKTYPESTHAHSVEFRVKSLDTINKIQESLLKAWQSGRSGTLNLSADECPHN